MTQNESTAKAPNEGRGPDGRFAPGNNLGIPFGPDNPPPRSPGRPKKDAWVTELEARLEDPRLRQAIADRLVRIVLKGGDQAAIRAAELIQDRVAGPLTQRIEAAMGPRQIIIMGQMPEPPQMPERVLALEQAFSEAEDPARIREQAR